MNLETSWIKVENWFVWIFNAAIPQARKASLTRFLEKRKERY